MQQQPPARHRQKCKPTSAGRVDHRFNDVDVTVGTPDHEPPAMTQPVLTAPPTTDGDRCRALTFGEGSTSAGQTDPGAAVGATGSH